MSGKPEYGSDVIAEMLARLGIPYVAFNPGATFRGIHDSLVNYSTGGPEVIEACHEEVSVAMAHGYAKATGKPMAVLLHDLVGLQNASMAIYNAFCDRIPIILLGGTGPLDINNRRPWIDWVHTALVQGNAVRDYVKWDDQPATIGSVPESLLQAYRIAMASPQGPVYVCYDTDLQEAPLTREIALPMPSSYPLSKEGGLSGEDLKEIAQAFVHAERPAVLVSMVGRDPEAFQVLRDLIELVPSPVLDSGTYGSSLSFPPQHPLFLTGANAEVLAEADFIMALEVDDLYGQLNGGDSVVEGRGSARPALYPPSARIISISVKELQRSSWATIYGRLQPGCIPYAVPVKTALTQLLSECHSILSGEAELSPERKSWNERWRRRHQELRQAWQQEARQRAGESPLAPPWVAQEVYRAIAGESWVLASGCLTGWALRLWEFEGADQYLGYCLGAGLGYGIGSALGVALAYRGSGRVVVDLQDDGDFLFTPSALWTAAHYQLPLLIVMNNNRTYYNSEHHQVIMARSRGREVSRAGIGTYIRQPEVDFAALARSFGVWGVGPVERPEDLPNAIAQALAVVKEGRPALVDVVTQSR